MTKLKPCDWIVVERFACNGEHSHFEILDANTGKYLVQEIDCEDRAELICKTMNTRAAESGDAENLYTEISEAHMRLDQEHKPQMLLFALAHLAQQGYLSQPKDNSEALEAYNDLQEFVEDFENDYDREEFERLDLIIRKALGGE